MMFVTITTGLGLGHRLDPHHYSPEAVALDRELLNLGNCLPIESVVNPERKITNGVRGPDLSASIYKLVRLQDCKDWEVDFDDCLTISQKQYDENHRCRLRVDDIVVAIGGYLGNAAIVTKDDYAVIGQHSAILPFGHSTTDNPRYILAYLNSRFGAIQFSRWSRGTVQAGLNLEDIGAIQLPLPHPDAQAYIGNKVRQAEALRARARRIESQCIQTVTRGFQESKEDLTTSCRCWWLSDTDLDTRLDPMINHPRLASHRSKLRSFGDVRMLGEIVENDFPSGKSFGEYCDVGPVYVRISDFDAGFWENNSAHISSEQHRENKKAELCQGDVIFARIGNTIGKVGFCDKNAPLSSASNNCTVLRAKRYIQGSWLFWCMRTIVGQLQVDYLKGQIAQPKLNQDELALVLIPLGEESVRRRIDAWTEVFFYASRLSGWLIAAARLLVEALIERKVTEAELIAANNDPSADRELMQKLTVDGFDVSGAAPLFDDLDRLQELLNETNSAGGSGQRPTPEGAGLLLVSPR